MKKALTVLLLSIILSAVLCICASADEIKPVGGKYSVTYFAGTQNAGNVYVISVVRGYETTDISEQSLVYMDYAVCDDDGYVSFIDFIPMEICDSTVLIGSWAMQEPIVYGTISGSTASGKILYHGTSPATVKIYSGSTLICTSLTDENGNYTLSGMQAGKSYKAVITKNGYLSYTTSFILTQDMLVPTFNIKICAGDLDNSGRILINDLSAIITQFGKSADEITIPEADFNCDGKVDTEDISILVKNYNRTDIINQNGQTL